MEEDRTARLVLLYQGVSDETTNILDDLKEAPDCFILDKKELERYYYKLKHPPYEEEKHTSMGRVSVITSRLPGMGKSTLIRERIVTKRRRHYMRIPIYGDQGNSQLIELFHQKTKEAGGRRFDLHLDVYPVHRECVHVLLFEFLILRKLRGKRGNFASIPRDAYICV